MIRFDMISGERDDRCQTQWFVKGVPCHVSRCPVFSLLDREERRLSRSPCQTNSMYRPSMGTGGPSR